jgi:hypothetical protein
MLLVLKKMCQAKMCPFGKKLKKLFFYFFVLKKHKTHFGGSLKMMLFIDKSFIFQCNPKQALNTKGPTSKLA